MAHIIVVALFLLFGIAPIVYSIVNLCKIFSCKKQVDAYCMAKERRLTGFKRSRNSVITFSYRYDGKDYYRETKLGVPLKFYNAAAQGEKYKIYINENKPQRCAAQRKATGEEIGYIIIGVFFIALAAFYSYIFLI